MSEETKELAYGGFAPQSDASPPVAICPLMGKECVGPNACAPAVLYVTEANAGTNPDIHAQLTPICPVASIVEAMRVTQLALIPLLIGGQPKEEEKELSDEEINAMLKKNIAIDQGQPRKKNNADASD